MSQQDLKKHIQDWVKNRQKIDSDLGEIFIGKQLGEGGNALVFTSSFSGDTAIKFLAESVSIPPSTRYARFLDEYRNLVKLVSTGVIVPLYQFGIQDMDGVHIPYIVMERCEKTLYDAFKNIRLVDLAKFQNLLERLLYILEVVHNAGIVHRDIKPQNILLRTNGEWVLGDFGIAWFDPDIHTRFARTQQNDRLANFEFSAPEQVKRRAYDRPVASMDLYALGQTLYYCVMGHAVKGPGYPPLGKVNSELGRYDFLIEKLIRQIPKERFQSVDEIRECLKASKKSSYDREDERMDVFFRQQKRFLDVLQRSLPGVRSYAQAKNQEEIDRVMSTLSGYSENCGLWFFQGWSQSTAYPIKKISDDLWLISHYECKIIDLWIYRHSTLERQYILIHLAPQPPFDIYSSEIDQEYLEAGYFQGNYITRGEYDDGYGLINGRIVETLQAELRVRNLKDQFFLLAPKYSVYNHSDNDEQMEEIYRYLLSVGKIDISILKSLEKLKRPAWMGLWD